MWKADGEILGRIERRGARIVPRRQHGHVVRRGQHRGRQEPVAVVPPRLPERGQTEKHSHGHGLAVVEAGVARPCGVVDVRIVKVGDVRRDAREEGHDGEENAGCAAGLRLGHCWFLYQYLLSLL